MNGLQYKSDRQQDEFNRVDARLMVLVLSVVGYCIWRWGLIPVITEVYRTQAEQDEIYLASDRAEEYGKAPWQSVHQYYRGVDLRVRDFTEEMILTLDSWIDEHFIYDKGRRESSLIHAVGSGGRHAHLQVDSRDYLMVTSKKKGVN